MEIKVCENSVSTPVVPVVLFLLKVTQCTVSYFGAAII